ncbi:radical SAM protein [Micromonospora sp. NPDC051196]|uniref:B12-binding domain-containing radical SAM protein n=1 Tax=Micromonospora sp. NPDC051196 TaxID=3155281 RepID=UPI00344A7655
MTDFYGGIIDHSDLNYSDESGGHALDDFLANRRSQYRDRGKLPGQRVPSGAVGIPVLAVLAPAVTDFEGVIEYPGDPMCLYAALHDNVLESTRALFNHWDERHPLRDIVLDWGTLPDSFYRASVSDEGIRTPTDRMPQVSDELVFDPRVWNQATKSSFDAILEHLRPRVLLISSVSAAHRYALEMAERARAILSDIYIILGGRHADETISWSSPQRKLKLDYSSTVRVLSDGRRRVEIDAVVSGDGSPLLDLLSTAVLLAMGAEPAGRPSTAAVTARLRDLLGWGWRPRGQGVIVLMGDIRQLTAVPITQAIQPSLEPAAGTFYDAFAIRSRFTVFSMPDGRARRTAHFLTTRSCPFRCTFCSESSAVTGPGVLLRSSETAQALDKMARLISFGAEAVFFDDPVFWSGRWHTIEEFADATIASRQMDDDGLQHRHVDLTDPGSRRRWRDLVWGAQLTVDVLLQKKRANIPGVLAKLHQAGCRYMYIGIESMSDAVMARVKKNLLHRDDRPWPTKVREALEMLKVAGIPVGTSVLFGLDGEDAGTIDETIERIGELVDESLIMLASPNILTYHPGTAIAQEHGQHELDYHGPMQSKSPYTFFEEAYEGVTTRLLSTDDIWRIHLATQKRWGRIRNSADLAGSEQYL